MRSVWWIPVFGLVALSGARQNITAYHRAYGPKNLIRVSQPTVTWEVWPSDGAKVTGVELSINGVDVKARYDERKRAVFFTPSQPLEPGTYVVKARVIVERELVVKRDWQFRIAQNSVADLPGPSAAQNRLIAAINDIRDTLGVPRVTMDDRLNAAAQSHSAYLKLNRTFGHYEQQGMPGFTGHGPGDRMEAFGYFGSSFEDVATGAPSIERGLQMLFDAPYHRIPFMFPGEMIAGTGWDGSALTVKFGFTDGKQVVVSPAPGQRDVPTSWNGNERPNPLRVHGASGTVGYPIMIGAFGPQQSLSVESATLTKGGVIVPTYLNSPENDDELNDVAFLMPKEPLQPLTTYTVTFAVKSGAGQRIRRQWSFMTGAR
ncbi:MAG: CAP domain-containing protein [Armatimonadetes bacterium]|nr:CAP domain-containing protein [Armatimonadota bacterium]